MVNQESKKPTRLVRDAQLYFEHTAEELHDAPDHWSKFLLEHVPVVVELCSTLADEYIALGWDVDPEVLATSAWLHDVGRLVDSPEDDHAVASEIEVRSFLQDELYPHDVIDAVAHCVRAHRNRDVAPQTIEAQLLAIADAVSHLNFATAPYIYEYRYNGKEAALAKVERDRNDIMLLDDRVALKGEWLELCDAWEMVLNGIDIE